MFEGKLLQPRYFEEFHCIGSDCEETCCSGWRVHVDKTTYSKYQGCSAPVLGPALRSLVTINEKATSDDDYAKIELSGGVTCPFLGEGLCTIQQQMGEDWLSNTCASYPRVTNRVEDVLQRSLDLACPEAARMVLMNPEPIEFREEADGEGAIRPANYPSLDVSSLRGSREPYRAFRAVRRQVMALLQNRAYPMWKRLLALGCLCDRLDEIARSGWRADSMEAIADFVLKLEHGGLEAAVAKCPAQPALQLEVVVELILERIKSDATPRTFLGYYRDFMNGIQWTAQSTMEEIAGRYAAAGSSYYVPFMAAHGHLMEHYMVNYAHRTLFPFGIPDSNRRLLHEGMPSPICAQYMLMAAYFAVTQAVMTGMMGLHGEAFEVAHAVRLIQSCTKTFEHSLTYPGQVMGMLAEKKMTSTAAVGVLVRN